ncbi:hypothetical protein LLH23_12005, partial [bacterium]|nr:hypothetical protein [bacterium]
MTTDEARAIITAARPCREVMDPVVYDRALRAANHEEPDRAPIWDYIDSWDLFQELAPGIEGPVQATAWWKRAPECGMLLRFLQVGKQAVGAAW